MYLAKLPDGRRICSNDLDILRKYKGAKIHSLKEKEIKVYPHGKVDGFTREHKISVLTTCKNGNGMHIGR